MSHAESCEGCGSFWRELQEAQRLTLNLPTEKVSADFREQLWERIHAGEGTPDSVFKEPVPLWSKLRYAGSGAAAAAALLIGLSFLNPTNGGAATPTTSNTAQVDSEGATPATTPNSSTRITNLGDTKLASSPSSMRASQASTVAGLLQPRQAQTWSNQPSWAKPLSYEVVALETSRQFEDRYMTAARGMRNMLNPEFNREAAVQEVLVSADEMRDFGQLLLDLREQQALFFTDSEVDVELRVAVMMLGQISELEARNAQTVEAFVAPVINGKRLSKISNSISLKPHNHREEERHLMVLNLQRPEVFSKLFFILGDLESHNKLQAMRPGAAFILGNDCDSRLVAPRSEMKANFMQIQIGLPQNR